MSEPLVVRVHRITSLSEPETGRMGKQIELVEVRMRSTAPYLYGLGEEESRLIKGLLTQFQSMGVLPPLGQIILPKLTLFLLDAEYEQLGLSLEVNDKLQISFANGQISFRKLVEGV